MIGWWWGTRGSQCVPCALWWAASELTVQDLGSHLLFRWMFSLISWPSNGHLSLFVMTLRPELGDSTTFTPSPPGGGYVSFAPPGSLEHEGRHVTWPPPLRHTHRLLIKSWGCKETGITGSLSRGGWQLLVTWHSRRAQGQEGWQSRSRVGCLWQLANQTERLCCLLLAVAPGPTTPRRGFYQ